MTHICVSKLNTICSVNALAPGRRQAIIWTNAGMLLIEPIGTNFSEILVEIHISSFKKMHFKMSSGKWRPFCLGPNMLRVWITHLDVGWFPHGIPKREKTARPSTRVENLHRLSTRWKTDHIDRPLLCSLPRHHVHSQTWSFAWPTGAGLNYLKGTIECYGILINRRVSQMQALQATFR